MLNFSNYGAVKHKIETCDRNKPIFGIDGDIDLSILNMSLYYKLVKIALHYQFSLR